MVPSSGGAIPEMHGVVQACPVFHPTEAEWAAGGGGPHGRGDALLSFIAKLRRDRADLAGVVRVVPPKSHAPPQLGGADFWAGQPFAVQRQPAQLESGGARGPVAPMSLRDYRALSERTAAVQFPAGGGAESVGQLERAFWGLPGPGGCSTAAALGDVYHAADVPAPPTMAQPGGDAAAAAAAAGWDLGEVAESRLSLFRLLQPRDRPAAASPRLSVGMRFGGHSRRRDCHFSDTPSPSLLNCLLKGEGVQQNDRLADG